MYNGRDVFRLLVAKYDRKRSLGNARRGLERTLNCVTRNWMHGCGAASCYSGWSRAAGSQELDNEILGWKYF
jgi:hypothetical protein